MARRKKGNIVKRSTKGRNTMKQIMKEIEPIDDTPENVARALFGLKRKGTKESKS